ncbi:hypothetical protein [Janthinobacterium sp. J1-1]|uniref:hypothetical protein n=1 Tax=unclassified Janthinobacterium TaxID=2610881 RepID=UPI0028113DE9|nr:hypothetical protein [Janthinobacterium sp. J1-1]
MDMQIMSMAAFQTAKSGSPASLPNKIQVAKPGWLFAEGIFAGGENAAMRLACRMTVLEGT